MFWRDLGTVLLSWHAVRRGFARSTMSSMFNVQSQLRIELSNRRDGFTTSFPDMMAPITPRKSSLRDGTVVHMTKEELADLRHIFDLFDADRSGSFTASELQVSQF